MSDMNIMQATDIATDGNVVAQIRARLAANSTTDASHARLMIEIAMLALAEAGRCLDDDYQDQDAIESAMRALQGTG